MTQSLKILHTNFHRAWGGQPSRILMLGLGLARRGHQVVIAAPSGSTLAGRARRLGLETFEEASFQKTKYLYSACRDVAVLNRFLRERPFDLLHAHGSQDLWTLVAARGMGRHRLPIVFTRHNTKRVQDHFLNRYLYRKQVDHLVVASESVLNRYESFLSRNDLDRKRISVVHSSFWQDRFHSGVNGAAVRSELSHWAPPSAPMVGYAGRLVLDKGCCYFLRAAAVLAKKIPEARFLLAGRGTEEGQLRAEANELGISDRVLFLGFREDMPEVTAAFDVCVLPSIDCDASSAVLKEAMALGKPVVATTIGGAAEIVQEGVTGHLVPPRDPEALASAILSILSLPDRGRSLGERGRERVEKHFTQDRLVEGMIRAYRTTLGSWRAKEGVDRAGA